MSDQTESQLPDLRYVRELAKVFKQYDLGEIEIETGEQRILLRRPDPNAALVSAPAALPVAAPISATVAPSSAPSSAATKPSKSATVDGDFITCPFVGTFYRSPNPDADVFVNVGDMVSPGQTVCIVEAMKLFNEIEAEFSCVIEEILVQDGQPVEFGANLFRVRKL